MYRSQTAISLWVVMLLTTSLWIGVFSADSVNTEVVGGDNSELNEGSTSLSAARSTLSWSLSAGGFEDDSVKDIAISNDGSIYTAGVFMTAMLYGDSGIAAAGMDNDEDFFVARTWSDGSWDWMVSGGSSTGMDMITAIDTDSNGDLLVLGSFCLGTAGQACELEVAGLSSISKGADENEGNAFIGKIASNGTWEWIETFGTDNDEMPVDILVDPFNNVYASFLFRGLLGIGGDSIPSSDDSYSLAVARLNQDRTWEFGSGAMALMGFEPFGSLCLAPNAMVYVVGTFVDSIIIDDDMLESTGGADVFVALMNSSGGWEWINKAGGNGDDWGIGCASSANGNLVVSGSFENTANFSNSTNVTSNGWYDLFIANANQSTGEWGEVHTAGGTGWESAIDIEVTNSDEIVMVGRLSSSFALGNDNLSSAGGDDILLAQLAANGTWNWGISAGSNGEDFGVSLALDAGDAPVTVSNFHGTVDLSGIQNTSQGQTDMVIWSYAQDVDSDGVTDGADNCPRIPNTTQEDHDQDGEGDACDNDWDGDGLLNGDDDCDLGQIGWTSTNASDHDLDGCLDAAEDLDDDNDGILDENDSCPKGPVGWISDTSNDQDQDGCEDVDSDSDGLVDQLDNCPSDPNPDQEDLDSDGLGDVCDDDKDGDGIGDGLGDDCPTGLYGWVSGVDTDHDGDGCLDSDEDNDDDGDGISDLSDDCPKGVLGWTSDSGTDHDGDGCKDASDEDSDDDNDGHLDGLDGCPLGVTGIAPLGQDLDDDGCNDLQEDDDADNDGVDNSNDACPSTPQGIEVDSNGCSANERDTDGDGINDAQDMCPNTPPLTAVNAVGCEPTTGSNGGGSSSSGVSSGEDEGMDMMPIIIGVVVAVLALLAGVITWMGNQTPTPSAADKFQPDLPGGAVTGYDQTSELVAEQTTVEEPVEQQPAQAQAANQWSDEQLLAAGWSQAQIDAQKNP